MRDVPERVSLTELEQGLYLGLNRAPAGKTSEPFRPALRTPEQGTSGDASSATP
jgi:hypothetical protein